MQFVNGGIGALNLFGNPLLEFPGLIDEVRVWNTDLSDADIVADYNIGVATFPKTDGLVHHFLCGDNPGDNNPNFIDIVGGANGIMQNMTNANFVNEVSS